MTIPSSRSPYRRLPRSVAAGLGLALLATGTAGCMGGHKVGGGPQGHTSAAPAELVSPGATAPRQSTRPNVVTIVTDDMRTDDLRWMPNVRHLIGDQGLNFQNSFANYPLCAPSRSTLLTGQMAHNTGVVSVGAPTNYRAFDDSATIGTAMNKAGYNTVFLGKYMNGYGLARSKVTGKNSFRYVPPGWTDWWGSTQRPRNSGFNGGGTYQYYHLLMNHNGTIDDSYKGVYQSVAEGRIARHMVRKYHRSAKPFFLYFAPIAPHFGGPRESDDPKQLMWPGTSSPEPFKTPARPKRVRGMFDRQIQRASGMPANGGQPQSQAGVSKLPRPMRWLPPIDRAERRAMLSLTRQRAEALFVLDQQIGKLIRTLKKTGEYSNTDIMFTSDNGYFLGEHRMRQGKIWTHEPSMRVPFLIRGPGVPRGVRYDPVSTANIAATILDIGGAQPPHPLEGTSVRPSFAADQGWLRPVLVENQVDGPELNAVRDARSHGSISQYRAELTGSGLRTARWKYVRYIDGDAELYDLAKDPNELNNVYGVKKYAAVQAQLEKVWAADRDCKGSACLQPLPASLQLGPQAAASLTRKQEAKVQARYGEPLL
jgi:N-acetylglucosamine-6-sulfatase